MVHGFVQQSHGRLELSSTPGQGTSVSMIFPVADSTAAEPPPANAPGGATAPEGGDLGGSRPCVLVVEDNDDVRELAESMLGLAGYAVKSAASGEQALALLEQGADVDLLFTDVIMPGGMNGLQLIDKARVLRPQLPVLVTTGYMDELPERGPGDGLSILGKPYKQEDLLDRVKGVLRNKD
jgi:CheY-like chemotaxis protein